MNRFKGGINLKNNVEINIDLIIEEYSHYVFTIVYNIAKDILSYQDIEEIIADTFYLFWKNQDKIQTNMKAYLTPIAKNCTYNKLKQNKQYIEYDDQILNEQGYKEDDFNRMLIIEEKIKRLTDQEKELFHLYYIEGYKIKEIAKMKNQKTNYTKVKLHRIRKKLRRKE